MITLKRFKLNPNLRLLLYSRHNLPLTTAAASAKPKPFEEIPGLSTLPLIGPLHHFLPVIGSIGPNTDMFEVTKMLYERYGSVVKLKGVFARANMVFLYEPEDFDQVYRSEDVLPLRPGFDSLEYYQTKMRPSIYGEVRGLTSAQGPQWRDFRTKVNPAFLKLKLVKLYAPALNEIAQEMVARLVKLKDDNKYLQNNFDLEMTKYSLESVGLIGLGTRLGCFKDDLMKSHKRWSLVKLKDDNKYLQNNFDLEMTKYSLESVGLIGLGTRLGCFKDDLSDDHPARQLITCAKDFIDLAFKLEFGPSLWKYISTSNFKKIVKTFDLQWQLSKKYIDEAKIKIKDRGYDIPEEEKSIIEKLLAVDEKVAVMMSNEMLLAGIDTVAFAITGLLYNLATNQQVQDKLREEIRAPEQSTRYLKACLKESLRMYPVLQANLRRTSKEHIVSNYVIPKGVDVIAPHEFLSQLEKYFPRPKEFIPERWIVDKTDPLYYGNAHPMVTLPFGFGIRMCIGRRIAELEIETFIKNLLTELKVTWDGPPAKTVTKVMNSFAKPYHFKFEPVK